MADDEIASILRDIRDRQREALLLQQEHMTLYRSQLDRVERINDRAEALQARSAKAIRLVLWLALPLVMVLLVLLLWPHLRAG